MKESKFNKLFNLVMQSFRDLGEDYKVNKNDPLIIDVIITALQILWDYRFENHLFTEIEREPESPFINYTLIQDNPKALEYYNTILNGIITIDADYTIIIKNNIMFKNKDVSIWLENLGTINSDNKPFIFKINNNKIF